MPDCGGLGGGGGGGAGTETKTVCQTVSIEVNTKMQQGIASDTIPSHCTVLLTGFIAGWILICLLRVLYLLRVL